MGNRYKNNLISKKTSILCNNIDSFQSVRKESDLSLFYLMKKYAPLLVIAAIVCIGIFFLEGKDEDVGAEDSEALVLDLAENGEPTEEQIDSSGKVVIDIKGEVHYPGVYEIDLSARVTDVIRMAGGFTENADQLQINLAQKVQDEMVIFVPKLGEEAPITQLTSIHTGGDGDNMVRINQASLEEIVSLQGIGPAKAQSILDYREENGPFKQIEDLLEVNGIGEKTLENIRDNILIP